MKPTQPKSRGRNGNFSNSDDDDDPYKRSYNQRNNTSSRGNEKSYLKEEPKSHSPTYNPRKLHDYNKNSDNEEDIFNRNKRQPQKDFSKLSSNNRKSFSDDEDNQKSDKNYRVIPYTAPKKANNNYRDSDDSDNQTLKRNKPFEKSYEKKSFSDDDDLPSRTRNGNRLPSLNLPKTDPSSQKISSARNPKTNFSSSEEDLYRKKDKRNNEDLSASKRNSSKI